LFNKTLDPQKIVIPKENCIANISYMRYSASHEGLVKRTMS